MQGLKFIVGDEPYLIIDSDIQKLNIDFLNNIDPGFFYYILKVHMETDIETEDGRRASVALKIALHHGLETFFSLAGALLQAPHCTFAWIPKCSTGTLRKIIHRISSADQTLYSTLKIERVEWESIAKIIFSSYKPNTPQQTEAINGFSKVWKNLASEFLDTIHSDEYNSLKHGFRVGCGGFKIEIGEANESKPEKMNLLGESKYGCSFLTVEAITKSPKERSLRVRKHYTNWSIERLALLGQLIYLSIQNIVTALRIINGIPASECQYMTPIDKDAFERPWQYTPNVMNMTWESTVESNSRLSTTKEILLAASSTPKK